MTKLMSKIIGICGRAGSGKDTICSILLKADKSKLYNRYSLAEPVKIILGELLGTDLKDLPKENPIVFDKLYVKDFIMSMNKYLQHIPYNKALDKMVLWLNQFHLKYGKGYEVTPRKMFQYFATDVIRSLDTTAWIDLCPDEYVIVPDIRFLDEAEFIKNNGVLIKVVRDNLPYVNPHVSEEYVDHMKADIIIYNNGSLSELVEEVKKVLDSL